MQTMSDTTTPTALTAAIDGGKTQNMRIILSMLLTLAPGCTFHADVDVTSGEAQATTDSGASGPQLGDVTGDEPAGTTGSSGESTGDAAASSTGAPGESTAGPADASTGEHTDCPFGTPWMDDGQCICDLGDGEKRAIDPAECGCVLTWGPMGGDCQCDGVGFPLVSCGWECTDITGECQCGGIDAPVTWCGLDPVLCEGDIEIDTNAPLEACVCVSQFGLPSEPVDPVHCGCVPVTDGCECDGITYDPWVCGWPCTTQDLSCLCGDDPAPSEACAQP